MPPPAAVAPSPIIFDDSFPLADLNRRRLLSTLDEHDDAVSVATTALATEAGTRVGAPANAFLRSVTFQENPRSPVAWSIVLEDPPITTTTTRQKRARDRRPRVVSMGGVVQCSPLQPGDAVRSINGRKLINREPSCNAERAMRLMRTVWKDEGYLSVAVGNDDGMDVLVQATVVKPRPNMTSAQIGLTVWYWGVLCIKSIDKASLFSKTVLQSSDHIYSVNDILMDEVSPAQFAHILTALPHEVTIVVKRGRQRWSGKFG